MTMPWCGLAVARWRKSSRLQVNNTQPRSWANWRTASSEESPGRASRKSVTSCRVARVSSSGCRAGRGQARTSIRSRRHLPGNEQVDLSSVVFIVGEALVNLRSGELREAVCRQRVYRFAILKQANDVVDGNPGTFHDRVPTPHARGTNDVTIGLRDRAHTWMVRSPSRRVNCAGSYLNRGNEHCQVVFEIPPLWVPSPD